MLVPAGVEQSFVTSGNSPSLAIGMSVYDNSGASPSLVHGPTLMTNFVGNSYESKYTFPTGNFLVFIAVYTDSSLTVLLNGYEEQVEAVSSRPLAFNAPVQSIVGYVVPNEDVEGEVQC
jgi:hypothetical protein